MCTFRFGSNTLGFGVAAWLVAIGLSPAEAAISRPKVLECARLGQNSENRFELSELDTQQPRALLDPTAKPTALRSQSGEVEVNSFATLWCTQQTDDSAASRYCFVFQTEELARMAQEKQKKTLALMSQFNSEAEFKSPRETIAIECGLK